MTHKINFSVNVIECNGEVFQQNYGEYIKAFRDDYYGNKIFYLYAPKKIYNEILDLTEEGIEIIHYE